MAGGWAKDGAEQEQIEATLEDEVRRVRSNLNSGDSSKYCEECGEAIPEARRKAILGVQLCVTCQSISEEKIVSTGGVNRRGSKDSQLR